MHSTKSFLYARADVRDRQHCINRDGPLYHVLSRYIKQSRLTAPAYIQIYLSICREHSVQNRKCKTEGQSQLNNRFKAMHYDTSSCSDSGTEIAEACRKVLQLVPFHYNTTFTFLATPVLSAPLY